MNRPSCEIVKGQIRTNSYLINGKLEAESRTIIDISWANVNMKILHEICMETLKQRVTPMALLSAPGRTIIFVNAQDLPNHEKIDDIQQK